jgi:hypothetical protein
MPLWQLGHKSDGTHSQVLWILRAEARDAYAIGHDQIQAVLKKLHNKGALHKGGEQRIESLGLVFAWCTYQESRFA